MNQFPLIVSFYTQNTLYQLEVQNLIASCEKWGLEYFVEAIPSLGSWEKNCAFKPLFLLKKILEFKRPLFWVDADAIFLQKPAILPCFKLDFAVRINPWPDHHPSKVMSGSLYVNATVGGERILKAWAKKCLDCFNDPHRTEEIWDQIVLRDVLQQGIEGAQVGVLPSVYASILGNPDDEKEEGEIIIGHMQASRRFKKMINDGA
jgi:hypothetical protein